MSNEKLDQLMDHSYDGIEEYDNPMPKWWLYLVLGGVVYAAWYLGYHMGYELTLQSLTGEIDRGRWQNTELALDIKANR